MISNKAGFRLCLLFGCFLFFILYEKLLFYKVEEKIDIIHNPNRGSKNSSLPSFLTNCILPDLDPWDPLIIPYLNKSFYDETMNRNHPVDNCTRELPPLTSMENGKVMLNQSYKNMGIYCEYRCLYPKNDYLLTYGNWMDINSDQLPDCDVVEVQCFDKKESKIYTTLHTQIYVKDDFPFSSSTDSQPPPPDVHIIIFDSVSYSGFVRTFQQTLHILKDSYGMISFPHLNKIGLNSRPNAYAFLLGRQLYGLKQNILHDETPTDVIEEGCRYPMDDDDQFIISQFRKAGYKTLMSEDWAEGVFNLNGILCAAFANLPTDHYMRPFQLRIEGDFFSEFNQKGREGEIYKALYRQVCKEPHNYVMDYLKQFIDSYENQPKFSLSWMSYVSHNDQSGLYHIDDYMYRFFRDRREKLKNSYIFLMGDHGPRYGALRDTKLGEFEDNNPGLFVVLPENLRSDKELEWALRQNSKELVSHFDLYATFVDIIRRSDPKQANTPLILHGSSFLNSLSQPRICADLRIPFEYCQCKLKKISRNNKRNLLKTLSKFMVFKLNDEIRKYNFSSLCEPLKLDPRAKVEVDEVEPDSGLEIYQVTVQTQPGGGRFYGYFHAKSDDEGRPQYELISESMPRLNAYSGQECLYINPQIKPYCFCRDQKGRFEKIRRPVKFAFTNITYTDYI